MGVGKESRGGERGGHEANIQISHVKARTSQKRIHTYMCVHTDRHTDTQKRPHLPPLKEAWLACVIGEKRKKGRGGGKECRDIRMRTNYRFETHGKRRRERERDITRETWDMLDPPEQEKRFHF